MELSQEELLNLVKTNIDDATSYINEYVNPERQLALDYYLRKPMGNEVDGKSKIVDSSVSDAVHGALPQLMKVFTSADVVSFLPTKQGTGDVAEQINHYVNHIFSKDNNGSEIMYQWFWDALVQKNGIVKAVWHDDTTEQIDTYKELTEDEVVQLLIPDNVEVISKEEVEIQQEQIPVPPEPVMTDDGVTEMIAPTDADGEPMMINQDPIIAYNLTIKTTETNSRVKITNVEPEAFIIDENATSIDNATFTAQKQLLTRADLVELGYDKKIVDDLTTADDIALGFDNYRYRNNQTENNTADKTQELLAYYECYIEIGNANGTSSMHRICYASNTILSDEETDYVPFYSICPYPVPHSFFGESIADKTIDIQQIKTVVQRQMLDNLYLTNNSRVGAVEGQVNLDDLLNSTAGGIIRMKNPNAIVPMQVQSSANQSFPMLEYLDNQQAKRTGVSDMNQGLDANVLSNVSATAVATMTAQSQGKLELIARIFADSGVSNLFQGIFHLICKYQDVERTLLVNNKELVLNPREWDNQYNVNINVGIGNGSRDEKIGMLQMVLAKQEQIIQQYGLSNPLVSLKQYRETLAKFINSSGYKDDIQFINEITDEQSQQMAQQAAEASGQPAPEVQAAQAIAEAEMQKAQMKAQTDAQKNELEMQKAMMKVQMEQQELELQAKEQQLKAAKDMLDIQTERAKLEADIRIRELTLLQKEEEAEAKHGDSEDKTLIQALDKINNLTRN